MFKGKHLLPKLFFASLFVHVTCISLFSLVIPLAKTQREPIKVSILPPSASPSPKVELARNETLPKIPRTETRALRDERIAMISQPQMARISEEQFTGSPQYVPVTEISREFEIPEFHVQLPDIISFKTLEKNIERSSSDIEIEGPAGSRKLIHKEQVSYPEWALKEGIEGNVRIKFWVEPDGKISMTNLDASSGSPALDVYSEQTLRKWFFEPVITDKQTWGIITFKFRLK